MMNKEAIYDAQISPLMAQVIQIAKANGIAAFISFHLGHDDEGPLLCTTCIPDENGKFPEPIPACYNATVKPITFLTELVEDDE